MRLLNKFKGTPRVERFAPKEFKDIVWVGDTVGTFQCFFSDADGAPKLLTAEEQDLLEEQLFHFSGGESIPTTQLSEDERRVYLWELYNIEGE